MIFVIFLPNLINYLCTYFNLLFICNAMRIATSIFLILVISMVSLQEATFYAFFKLNQDYFAKNLCVEKEIKESKCKGHCQLRKIVKKSKDAPSQDLPIPTFEPTKFELFLVSNKIKLRSLESKDKPSFLICEYYDSQYSDSIFHPPNS